MAPIYRAARAAPDCWWEHVWSDGDRFWQLAGELFDGSWGWRRAMSWACHNTAIRGVGHGDLMHVETWACHRLWCLLER